MQAPKGCQLIGLRVSGKLNQQQRLGLAFDASIDHGPENGILPGQVNHGSIYQLHSTRIERHQVL